MTTILAHRQTLYADSRCTFSNASFPMQKVHCLGWSPAHGVEERRLIVACAGATNARDAFLTCLMRSFERSLPWHQGHMVPERMLPLAEEDFSALVIAKDGIWHFDETFSADKVDGLYFAIGSGQEAVLGAIECQKMTPTIGVQPVRAMMAALQVDKANSGGPIQHMTWGEFELRKEAV